MEFKDNWNNLLIGIIGSIIGGMVIFVLLKSQLVSQQRQQSLYNDPINSHEDIYNGLSNISNRLRMIESNIQNAPIQQHISVPTIGSSYKNNEKWVITRDKTGHIDSLEIVRDAKVGK